MDFNINGRILSANVDPQKPLLWVLREDFQLLGAKYSCGIGYCGSCTVLVEGEAVQSCQIAAGDLGNKAVITIEGLNDPLGRALKEAWLQEKVSQCGYCQPGQIIAAYALLAKIPNPSEQDIMVNMTNRCRCGTYQRIKSAIALVARSPESRQGQRSNGPLPESPNLP